MRRPPIAELFSLGGRGHRSDGVESVGMMLITSVDLLMSRFSVVGGVHSLGQVLNKGHKRASGWLRQNRVFEGGVSAPEIQ